MDAENVQVFMIFGVSNQHDLALVAAELEQTDPAVIPPLRATKTEGGGGKTGGGEGAMGERDNKDADTT